MDPWVNIFIAKYHLNINRVNFYHSNFTFLYVLKLFKNPTNLLYILNETQNKPPLIAMMQSSLNDHDRFTNRKRSCAKELITIVTSWKINNLMEATLFSEREVIRINFNSRAVNLECCLKIQLPFLTPNSSIKKRSSFQIRVSLVLFANASCKNTQGVLV